MVVKHRVWKLFLGLVVFGLFLFFVVLWAFLLSVVSKRREILKNLVVFPTERPPLIFF